MKSVFDTKSKFSQPKPTASDINKIIKFLDTNEATRSDDISANLLRCQSMLLTVVYLISLSVTYLKANFPSMLKQLQ